VLVLVAGAGNHTMSPRSPGRWRKFWYAVSGRVAGQMPWTGGAGLRRILFWSARFLFVSRHQHNRFLSACWPTFGWRGVQPARIALCDLCVYGLFCACGLIRSVRQATVVSTS
jgi:hypothetical protein